jgi:protein-tyrosine phosphatase
MAESVMAHLLGPELASCVDSAGVGSWHVGEPPDPRTQAELARHGIRWVSRARQVRSSDFANFDHVVALDEQNRRDLLRWPGCDRGKVSLLMEWVDEPGCSVPDPYYGGAAEFRLVFDMCHRACDAMRSELFSLGH